MSKKKSETKQSQTQSGTSAYDNKSSVDYGWEQTPDSADITAFRNYRPQADQGISSQAAASRNRLNSSFVNPLGANYSPVMRDQIMRAGNRDIDQTESQAFRAGAYDVSQQRAGQLGSLAALTAPRLVQRGSTSSGTGSSTGTASGTSSTTQGNNLFGDIMGTAQGVASVAMM